MNAKTLHALNKSIDHWRRLASGNRRHGETPDGADCSLCKAFFHNRCEGCPIKIATASRYCVGTPFHAAYKTAMAFGLDSTQFRGAAKVELDFLISLRPKKKTTD